MGERGQGGSANSPFVSGGTMRPWLEETGILIPGILDGEGPGTPSSFTLQSGIVLQSPDNSASDGLRRCDKPTPPQSDSYPIPEPPRLTGIAPMFGEPVPAAGDSPSPTGSVTTWSEKVGRQLRNKYYEQEEQRSSAPRARSVTGCLY